MKLEFRTISVLLTGLALYLAIGSNLDMHRGFVDSLVLAELLSRIFIRAKS
jgi:hypothetical protein